MLSSPILLFIKAPVKGQVKSRLAAVVGDEAALALYRAFVLDILATIERTGHPRSIFFYPPHGRKEVIDWLGPDRDYVPQQGDDLGERMANAFAARFERGASRAILIGSDLPDLPAGLLINAIRSLDDHDAVLGPARDGGYYLIGFRRNAFSAAVFRGIAWGSSDVFARTRAMFAAAGLSARIMPEWSDIDTIEELRSLASRCESDPSVAAATCSILLNMDIRRP